MFKSILLITMVLQICSTQRACNSCKLISRCKAAFNLSLYQKDNETKKLFQKAYCGEQWMYNGEVIIKVCCSDFSHLEKSKEALLPTECGSIPGNRIIGGRKAALDEFPWMAVIRYIDPTLMCAGTVISSKYILTAGHCVMKKIDYVGVGEYNLLLERDCDYLPGNIVYCRSYVEIQVAKVIIHEEFNARPLKNDIALLRLDGGIDFQKSTIEPICLPVPSELRNKELAHRAGVVTGWGYTKYNEPSAVLRKVKVPVKPRCFAENILCAGKKNKDSCVGDSGGPLMMTDLFNNVNRYVQYGIVSFGPKKCGSSSAAIYVDVRKYVNWILDHIRE